MATRDPAKEIKTSLASYWSTAHPLWTATLQVDDDYQPTAGKPTVLVADDGGTAVHRGPWMVGKTMRRRTIRLTSFATGRDEAKNTLDEAVDRVVAHRPAGIARIDDVSDPLITRDGDTGAYLASVTVLVIVKPITA